ncbi:MAG: hypothetical protein QG671_997, partial [Actinomycetota bacterium]|nr:hypothetical protein [Actinomycetota bacterium]
MAHLKTTRVIPATPVHPVRGRTLAVLGGCALMAGALVAAPESAAAQIGPVGAGSYTDTLPPGARLPEACGSIPTNPRQNVAASAPTGAVPTNEWWSSLLFKRTNCNHSEALVAGPMSFRTDSAGLGVSYPTQVTNVGTANGTAEYHYYYQRDFQLGLEGLNADKTTVAGWSDWTVSPHWQDGSKSLTTTIGHGLPFIYATTSGAPAKLSFDAAPNVWLNSGDRIGFRVNGHDYVAYAPTGANWAVQGNALTSTLNGKNYFSVAVLPTTSTTTAAQRTALASSFGQYAYAFV